MNRPRLFKFLRWASITICALAVTVSILNLRYSIRFWLGGEHRLDLQGMRLGFGKMLNHYPVQISVGAPQPAKWLPYYRSTFNVYWSWYAAVPYWIILVIAGALVAATHRRTEPGHCRKCDYNLTGNESGVCPECGTKIETV